MESTVKDSLFSGTESEELIFADEDQDSPINPKDPDFNPDWTVLIVDDELEIHKVTKLALQEFKFEGRPVKFISAFSGEEAKRIMSTNSEIAVILLDVIMETDDAGLRVVDFVRKILGNQLVRIILRTGQPGQAPENVIVLSYDINDYKSKTELTTQKLFTTMVTALRSFQSLISLNTRKQELEAIANASARFVPRDFLKFLEKDSVVEVELGDQVQANMTVLFADIHSFTDLSESLSPQENFHFLNSFLSWIGPVVRQHQGFIDKYIGDSIMALFPNQAEHAIQAAIEMQKQISIYNAHPKNRDFVPIVIGIGLHTGNLILGTIGEGEHMESTVIANTVSLAARMESLTKLYNAGIITSVDTISQVSEPNNFHWRLLDYISLKGKSSTIEVIEIYDGDPEPKKNAKTSTKIHFEQAVKHYHRQEFDLAEIDFRQVLQVNSQDRAAEVYLQRSQIARQLSLVDSTLWQELSSLG